MADYNAPLKDMTFVLNELVGLDKLSTLEGFEDVSENVVTDILEQAGKFANGVLAPLNSVGDSNGANCVDNAVQETKGFADAYSQMVEGGWITLSGHPDFGGMGMPECVGIATTEMWSAANTSFSLCPLLSQGATSAIYSHASDELKQIYLHKLVSGEWTGTMNLTEPSAGSDLAVIRTKAIANGDHYLISGTKIFITWGDHQMTENIVHLVLARTPDAPEGVKGISLFIVPKFLANADGSLGKRNDAYPGSVEHKMGIHASPTCIMNFGANEGAVGYLVGEENHGLAYMFTMMNHARLNVGIQAVGISDQSYQHAVAYAKDRVQGIAAGDSDKGTIIRHADVRRMLMVMRSLTEASRAVCYLASSEFDLAHHSDDDAQTKLASARGEFLTPIAKGWSTEVSQEITYLGVQIHGGMGFVEETGAAQFMRDTRITTIYEGTTGIQANDLVGRKLIRDNGAECQRLMTEIRELQQQLIESGEDLNDIANTLGDNVNSVETLITWILDNYKNDPRLPGAVAVNLMMALGTLCGGWLLAKSALIAKTKLSEDEKFYSAKIITARFYSQQIMPRTETYVKAALTGSEITMALSEDQF